MLGWISVQGTGTFGVKPSKPCVLVVHGLSLLRKGCLSSYGNLLLPQFRLHRSQCVSDSEVTLAGWPSHWFYPVNQRCECRWGFLCFWFCLYVFPGFFFLKRFWVEDRHLSQVPMGSVNPVFCKAFTVTSVSSQRNLTSALQMNDLLRTSTMIMIQCLCY